MFSISPICHFLSYCLLEFASSLTQRLKSMQSFKNINFFLRLSDGNVHREGGIPPEPPNITYTLPILVYLCFYVGG